MFVHSALLISHDVYRPVIVLKELVTPASQLTSDALIVHVDASELYGICLLVALFAELCSCCNTLGEVNFC